MKGSYMLESQRISRRQSEIREELAALAATDHPSEEQRSRMSELDQEYRSNETRYRAALIAEDTERRSADEQLGDSEGREWADLVSRFEMRQAVLHLDEGRALDGATAEVVQELRSRGGYRGVPIPFEALEQRAEGVTTADDVPLALRPGNLIGRLFPDSVAQSMGARMINIATGGIDYPITSGDIRVGWAESEGDNVPGPEKFETVNRPLRPDHTLGVQIRMTRRALKQSSGIEAAARADMRAAIQSELDRVVFGGAGAGGEPAGVVAQAADYGITVTELAGPADYGAFRAQVRDFILGNAAGGPSDVRALIRPEMWDEMDDAAWDPGSGITEYDRLIQRLGRVVMTSAALDAGTALLTTTAGGVAPIYLATWGGIDLIRDPYSDAQSGGLRLTALVTADVTISRAAQLRVLTEGA